MLGDGPDRFRSGPGAGCLPDYALMPGEIANHWRISRKEVKGPHFLLKDPPG